MADALKSLIRVADADVDDHKRRVGELQRRADALADSRRELDLTIAREQQAAAADPLTLGYEAWAATARERRQALIDETAAVEAAVADAREAMFEAWRRKRSLELVHEARLQRQAAAEARAEQETLDEIALDRHRRRGG